MKLLIVLLFVVLTASYASAQCNGLENQQLYSGGYQRLAVSSTAVGLTIPTTTRVAMAVVIIAGNTIMYRDDGTDPTATDGMPVTATQSIIVCPRQLRAIRFIQASAAATVHISYYSQP